jgi:hypothetical protein
MASQAAQVIQGALRASLDPVEALLPLVLGLETSKNLAQMRKIVSSFTSPDDLSARLDGYINHIRWERMHLETETELRSLEKTHVE